VARYAGEHKVKSFSCLDQYLCMTFAQLTYRESLRDIESSLRAQAAQLYHLGIRGNVSRNTLVNANSTRDWRIHANFAERLIVFLTEPASIRALLAHLGEPTTPPVLAPRARDSPVLDAGFTCAFGQSPWWNSTAAASEPSFHFDQTLN
jgi:hypothetical protein